MLKTETVYPVIENRENRPEIKFKEMGEGGIYLQLFVKNTKGLEDLGYCDVLCANDTTFEDLKFPLCEVYDKKLREKVTPTFAEKLEIIGDGRELKNYFKIEKYVKDNGYNAAFTVVANLSKKLKICK